MHISRTAATLVAVASLTLSACSSREEPAPERPATRSQEGPSKATEGRPRSSPDATGLTVSIAGDEVRPNAVAIDLAPGEKLAIDVTSDRVGELHVHSKPEQYLEFGVGKTSIDLVVDTPGTVEVEDDETSAVVAILEIG